MKYALPLLLLLPTTLHAEPDAQYQRDKSQAMAQLDGNLQKQCLEDVSRKVSAQTVVKPLAKPHFSDAISHVVYRQFYWNGSDRGVAFTMPVQAHDQARGPIATDIACFYAMTDSGLKFQLSQQVMQRL